VRPGTTPPGGLRLGVLLGALIAAGAIVVLGLRLLPYLLPPPGFTTSELVAIRRCSSREVRDARRT
jgi:hypothetical protein